MAQPSKVSHWGNFGSLHGGPRLVTRPVEVVGQEVNERFVVHRQQRDYIAEHPERRHDRVTRAAVALVCHALLRQKIGERQGITDIEALGLDAPLARDIIARLQRRNPTANLLP